MRINTLAKIGTACLVLGFAGVPAWAQDAGPSLDDLLNLPGTGEREDAGEPAGPPEAPAMNLGDVFSQAVSQMGEAAERVESDPGLGTQRVQEEVLVKLDQIIAEVQRRQQQGQGQGQGQAQGQQRSSQPGTGATGQQPGQQPGPGQPNAGRGDGNATPGHATAIEPGSTAELAEAIRQGWGSLPPRARDQISQGLTQHVSPVYRDATEAYFRRLAELGESQ